MANEYEELASTLAEEPGPQAPQNPYEALLGEERKRQGGMVRDSLLSTKDTTPDARAEAIKLGDRFRLPHDVVERNLPYYRAKALEDGTDYEQLLGSAPKLAEFLARNPGETGAAKDDLPKLVELENALTWGGAILRSVDNAQAMVGGFIGATGELVGSKSLADYGNEVQAFNREQSAALGKTTSVKDIRNGWDFTQWLKESIGTQVATMGPVMAGGLAGAKVGAAAGTVVPGVGNIVGGTIGAAIGAFIPSFVMGVGEVQGAIKELDPNAEAPAAAFLGGSGIAALESIIPAGVGKGLVRIFGAETAEEIAKRALMQTVKPQFVRSVAGEAAYAITGEGITEAVQEAISAIAAAQGADKPMDWAQTFDQMIEAGAAGAAVGGAVGVTTTSLSHNTEVARFAAAQQQKLFFDSLASSATDSKLAQRLPDAYKKFVEHATKDGPVENVYVDTEEFTKYWQGKNVSPEAIAKELTGSDTALAEAREAGTKLRISTADYAAKLAGTEHHSFFSNEMTLDPDMLTPRQAAAAQKELEQEAEKIAEAVEAAKTEDPDAAVTPMREQVRTQLAADPAFQQMAVRSQVDVTDAANQYAAGVEAVFTTLGKKLGRDPGELFARYGLKFGQPAAQEGAGAATGAGPDATALSQGDVPGGPAGIAAEVANLLRAAGIDIADTPVLPQGERRVATDQTYEGQERRQQPADEAAGFTPAVQRERMIELSRDPNVVVAARKMMARLTDINAAREEAAADLEGTELGGMSIEVLDDDIQENASGESAASQEALSRDAGMRARGEQFVVFNRAGIARPLIGPDAVDYQAREGETYGVLGPEGFRTLDARGGRVPEEGEVRLFQAKLPHLAVAPAAVNQGRVTLSTRVPFKVDAPAQDAPLITNLETATQAPEVIAKLAEVFSKYPQVPADVAKRGKPEQVLESFIATAMDNLRWLHDLMPQELRDRAKLWYVGAHRISHDLADEHGMNDAQAAAVLAVLSPQMDWFKNVALAERAAAIFHQAERENPVFSPAVMAHVRKRVMKGLGASVRTVVKRVTKKTGDAKAGAAAGEKYRKKKMAELAAYKRAYEGVAWRDLPIEGQAILLRAIDETTNPREYHVILPEGEKGDLARNLDGRPTKIGWGTYQFIENAISVMRDGSIENISKRVGGEHKVRSFFNNISDPWNPNAVTIDTHAVAAAHIEAFAGSAREVKYTMGGVGHAMTGISGSNAVYAEAYFRLAKELGLSARELQSITWEAVRALFSPAQKRADVPAVAKKLWKQFRSGKLTEEQLHASLLETAGGLGRFAWEDTPARVAVDEGRLRGGDVQPLRPDVSARRGGDRAGAGGSPRRNADVGDGPVVPLQDEVLRTLNQAQRVTPAPSAAQPISDQVSQMSVADVARIADPESNPFKGEEYQAELTTSIAAEGIREPLNIWAPADEPAQLQDGHHRLRAAIRLGLKTVPVRYVDEEGNPIKSQSPKRHTETAAFKAWFGDSKAVDANGNPQVVYHGTPTGGFTVFDPSKQGSKGGHARGGFSFTTDKNAAAQYAEGFSEESNRVDAMIDQMNRAWASLEGQWNEEIAEAFDAQDMENPPEWDARVIDDLDYLVESINSAAAVAERLGFADAAAMMREAATATAPGTSQVYEAYLRVPPDAPEFHATAKTLGQVVAGLDVRTVPGRAAVVHLDDGNKIFYVADSTQIKSATDNAGTFDPSDPSILRQKTDDDNRGEIVFNKSRTSFRVQLLENADLSTVVHEMGHFYLEVLGDISSSVPADATDVEPGLAAIKRDYETILAWLGASDRDTITEEQHEKFARGFEAYLFEGKAKLPLHMRGVFARFASWMAQVYKSPEALQVQLTDEVRGVFDRLVAADDAIANANAEAKIELFFATAEEMGVSPREFQAYIELATRENDNARATLQRRIMKELTRERTVWWKERREEVRRDVAGEVHAEKVYQALAALQKGERPDGTPMPEDSQDLKISRESIVRRYGKDRLAALPKPWVYTNDGGVDVEQVAELFGFTSGDELLLELAGAEKMDAKINRVTNERMKQRYGDMRNDGQLEKQARQIVQDNRGAVLTLELQALAKKARQVRPFVQAAVKDREAEQRSAERAIAAALRNVAPLETVRAIAEARIAKMTVRTIKPHEFAVAARHAGDRAVEAAAAGKLEEALAEKQKQRLSVELYNAATAAIEEADKIRTYMNRFSEAGPRGRLGKAGDSYIDQVDALREKYEFIKRTGPQLRQRSTLVAWVAARMAEGHNVDDIPAETLEAAQQVNYTQVPIEKLREVRDAVKRIEHLARTKNRLLSDRRQRAFEKAKEDLVGSIERNSSGRKMPIEFRRKEERQYSIASAFASHARIARLARALDGYVDAGPVWDYIIRPLNEAADNEVTRRITEGKAFTAIRDKHYPGSQLAELAETKFIPQIGASLSKEGRLAVALNWGNETSRQRVLNQPGRPWNEAQVRAILDTLDQRDWLFVQDTWDYLNTFWQEISDKQQRVTGLRPEKVEAAPVVTRFGVFRGGYYPLAYDSRRTARAQQVQAASDASSLMQAAYVRQTTARGHIETRKENVELDIRLDLGVMFGHLDRVIHDLTHHEPLLDVARLLRDRQISQAIINAAGAPVYEQFTSVLTDIATGGKPGLNFMDRAANFLRTGTQIAQMGLSFWTALQQPLGLFNGAQRVGPKWVARGMKRWLRDAATFENTAEWIHANSKMMAARSRTATQDLADVRRSLQEPGGWFDLMVRKVSADKLTQQSLADAFLWHIGQAQKVADIPTWLGAYEKAMANEARGDEELAFRLADQAVLDSQGGGQIKDLAQVQRGGPVAKLFMTFFSYGVTIHNATADAIGQAKLSSPKSMARMMGHLSLIYLFPALGTVTLRQMFGKDEDDDYLEQVGSEMLSTAMNTMVFLRELGALARDDGSRGYAGPAGTRFFDTALRLGQQIKQGELDEPLWKSLNAVAGVLLKYPASQVQRSVDGWVALMEGRTSNPGVLLVGPPPEN
jgi:hypothetical protein